MQYSCTQSKPTISKYSAHEAWWLAVLLGIIQMLLGIFLLTAPAMTTITLIQFVGLYWFVLGIISIFQIFSKNRSVSRFWFLISGILGIISGFLVLRHPIFSTFISIAFLTYLIIFTGIIRGIVSLTQGFHGEGSWNLILGITLLIISVYLLFNPIAAALSLPIFIGFFSFIGGLALLYTGMMAKAYHSSSQITGKMAGRVS